MNREASYTIRLETQNRQEIELLDEKNGKGLLRFQVEGALPPEEMYTAAQLLRAASGFSGIGMLKVERRYIGPSRLPVLLSYPSDSISPAMPLLLLQHGFRANKDKVFRTGIRFAAAGFFTVMPDAAFHGERYSAAEFNSRFGGSEKLSMRNRLELVGQTLQEDLWLIDFFAKDPQVDPSRISVSGLSMGGTVALLAAEKDSRVQSAVAFIPVLDFENLPGTAEAGGIDLAELSLIRGLDPLHLYRSPPSSRLFVLAGADDHVTGTAGARKLAAKIGALSGMEASRFLFREYPEVGHDVTPQMADDAVTWLLHGGD